jgi:hypothetical protein
MGTFVDHQGVFHNERRRNYQLRAIFDVASTRIAHLVDAEEEWRDPPLEYLAQRLIHESYPHLSADEVRILVGAIERKHKPH